MSRNGGHISAGVALRELNHYHFTLCPQFSSGEEGRTHSYLSGFDFLDPSHYLQGRAHRGRFEAIDSQRCDDKAGSGPGEGVSPGIFPLTSAPRLARGLIPGQPPPLFGAR